MFCFVQAAFIGLWDVSADTLMKASLWASETWGMRSEEQRVYLVLYHIPPPRWHKRRSLDREGLCSLTKVALPLVILQYYEDVSLIFLKKECDASSQPLFWQSRARCPCLRGFLPHSEMMLGQRGTKEFPADYIWALRKKNLPLAERRCHDNIWILRIHVDQIKFLRGWYDLKCRFCPCAFHHLFLKAR